MSKNEVAVKQQQQQEHHTPSASDLLMPQQCQGRSSSLLKPAQIQNPLTVCNHLLTM
jgi:hypothetical protein